MTEPGKQNAIDLIAKLLAKAEGCAGTPEGETAENCAFHLLAKHGIAYNDVRPPSQTGPDIAVREDFPLHGDYLHQQIILLARIASALHCSSAYWLHSQHSATVEIYGVPRHLDRVRLLHRPLLTRMLRQATTSAPPDRNHQISWMQGFSLSVRARLRTAETAAATEADNRTGSDLQTRTLAADAKRAEIAKKQALPTLRRSAYNPPIDSGSFTEGYRAGENTDLI
ncbi:DUF2786 domain-containing protein [Nocardia arthritidis]|uniref:DUF2786 domain-containing protein n=1 Tax=Nocardia arthritidis TaxID=228602 RepID=UPI00142DEF75|nr:DUF2786 domain-containing protein [Nocardia arthritidis]